MKKIQILLFAMAAMAAASCSEKEEMAPVIPDGNRVLREFSAVATKAALQSDGTTVVWSSDDTISVFDGVANNKFTIKDYTSPSASAKFAGSTDASATEFYAVYPYASSNSLDGSKVSATVPAAQTAVEGSFDPEAAVSVAYTDADLLAFHNVTALIGIKLASSQTNVSSIVLTGNCGESVAGAVSATLSSAGAVTAIAPSSTGSKKATLSGSFVAGGMYYLAFIPQNFSEGITITANYADGKSAKLVSTLDWDAEAGKSYNVVDFGTASYLEFAESRFTFDYGETKVLNFTAKNITSVTSITLPAGWTYSGLTDTQVSVTAPAKSVVTDNVAGTIYKPCGDAVLSCTTASGTKNASVVVRLRGINNNAEFDEFRTAYGNGSAFFGASGVSYNRRLTDCADYLVAEEITLNDNISITTESAVPYYIIHHIEHNLNGNGKTITMNVNASAWPTGFCQETFGTVTVYDLNLAGTVNWTYSAAGTTAGVCGGFAGRFQGSNAVSLKFKNVNNSVNVTWTSASTADPTKHHAIGGFVGFVQNKPLTFENCTYSGTITKNCRSLAEGGFVGWNSGTSVSKFDNCRFTGKIECTATSSKSAWTASTNLEFMGGFVGATDQQETALLEFKGCESAGTIKVAGGARELGGFVGKASCPITFADNADAVHCTFNGSIDYTETDAPASAVNILGNVGGFIGMKTAFATSFSNCSVGSAAKITIVGGAYCAGGFVGQAQNRQEKPSTATLTTFTDCTFGGTLDYSSYDKATTGNMVGRIGGFVGANGYHETKFTNCVVASTGVVSSKNDFSNSGGFVGNGGDTAKSGTTANVDRGTVIMNNCQFHGTLSHTAKYGSSSRRMGGFVGDASRVVKLTDCTFDGTLVVHEASKGMVGCGGFLGRTTAAATNHTMQFELNNCVFSGSMTVYNPKSQTIYGTLIGTNVGYAVTTIDAVSSGTTNVAINYGTTTVSFSTE